MSPAPTQPTRRRLLGGLAATAGLAASAPALGRRSEPLARPSMQANPQAPAPRAKRVIWLHMAGSPSQLDLFDPKPALEPLNGKPIPAEFIENERFAFIKGTPKVLASPYRFKQHGESGAWLSELLPHTASIADRLTFVRSMHTTQFNHAPAQIFLSTGHERLGRPSFGSWLDFGLGALNPNLPAFTVLVSGQFAPSGGQALWSSGFLPTIHQGVQLRTSGDPVLFLSDPPGVDRPTRRATLDCLRALNQRRHAATGDPEIETRIAQYELAYRMQTSVPALADLSDEPQAVLESYGLTTDEASGGSSFARNCLLARRLIERDVRCVQLYHWGWDSHGTNPSDDIITSLPERCRETDRASAALVKDLEQRGLLDETLVIWGGEFGRTPMNEERNQSTYLGRDHHPHAFSLWMAGGGLRAGLSLGETDELGYRVVADPVSVHDLHATLLHLLGLDHTRLTYRHQGRDFRLTDVYGSVVDQLLA